MINSFAVQRGDRICIPVFLMDSTNRPSGKTTLSAGGITCNYVAITSQTPSSNTRTAYTVVAADWYELSATNMPGMYLFRLPAAMVATAGSLAVRLSASGADDYRALLRIVPWTQGNIRVTGYKASSEITGRRVAAGAISHLLTEVKSETASDWTTVLNSYYTRWAYFNTGDVDPGSFGETFGSAPTDGTFTGSTQP